VRKIWKVTFAILASVLLFVLVILAAFRRKPTTGGTKLSDDLGRDVKLSQDITERASRLESGLISDQGRIDRIEDGNKQIEDGLAIADRGSKELETGLDGLESAIGKLRAYVEKNGS